MDKLKSMAAFVCIAEQGSLTAASQVLGASPTVVRTLAALEADLGVRLFNRSTRRIALTNEGLCYLDSCRHVLATWKRPNRRCEDTGELAGQLTITAPVLFGQMHVAPSLNRFVRQHHKVRCSLVLADRQVNLLEEGIDLGVRIGRLNDSSLVAHQVGQVRRMVVAAPACRPRASRRIPRTCCRPTASTSPAPAIPGGPSEQWPHVHLPVAGNLEFNHVAPALGACLDGLGFGMFLSYQVAPHVAQGRRPRCWPTMNCRPGQSASSIRTPSCCRPARARSSNGSRRTWPARAASPAPPLSERRTSNDACAPCRSIICGDRRCPHFADARYPDRHFKRHAGAGVRRAEASCGCLEQCKSRSAM